MLKFLLLTIALPTMLSGVVTFVGAAVSRRAGRKWSDLPPWTGPIAVGAAFAAGFPGVLGKWPSLRPSIGEEWMLHVALAAAAAGVLAAISKGRAAGGFVAVGVASLAAAALILALPLRAAVDRAMGEGPVKAAWIAALAALVVGPILLAERAARRSTGPGAAAGLWVALTISSLAILLSPSAKISQLAALLSMGTGWVMLVAVLTRAPIIAHGTLIAALPVHAGLWMVAHFYGEAHWASALLGIIAPAGAAVALIPGIARLRGVPLAAVQSLACALPAIASAVIEYSTRPPPSPYG